MNLPVIDERPCVRLWDDRWECFATARVPDGQRPIDVIEELMVDRAGVRATVDFSPQQPWKTRWSGFVYRGESGELKEINHSEMVKLLTWPEIQP